MSTLKVEEIFGENLNKLPVYARTLIVVEGKSHIPKCIQIVKHNTKEFIPYPVYKPISKFSGKING